MAYIEFSDVSKIYKMGEHEIHALDRISFTVERANCASSSAPVARAKRRS